MGSTHNSGGFSLRDATVNVNGYETQFARVESSTFNVAGKNYNFRYDLRTYGACLAIYGSYSGGNAILVMP